MKINIWEKGIIWETLSPPISLSFSLHNTRLPSWLSGKESACQCRRQGFDPWVGKIPWMKKWQPTPVFFAGKSLGQRSLADYSPWGRRRDNRSNLHPIHFLTTLLFVNIWLLILKKQREFFCLIELSPILHN